jgi:hypothetical protein
MASNPLPLSLVVDVAIEISPLAPATPQFNQGLVVGTSTVIPSVGGSGVPRIRQYASLAAMVTDGFSTTSPEYLEMSNYFGQTPAPVIGWVGRQDLTALQTLTIDAAGTGWAVGDKFLVTQAGGSYGYGTILAETAGVPSSIGIVQGSQGTGYTTATDLTTTAVSPSTGTGLTVNITAVGETPLQAIQACRLANPNWWAVVDAAAVKADNIAIGEWAQSQIPQLCYLYTTADADALSGAAGNVFSTLKAGNYSRAFGIYSTTQGGLAPNNIYAASAVMGAMMGLNTGLVGSYFTMKFKELVGVVAETELTLAQVQTIEGNNGNLYVNYANAYTWLEQGVVASGQFVDEILFLDMLASNIQYNVLDVLTENPAVPQTDAGETQLINAVNQACSYLASIGFLATGVWEGTQIQWSNGTIALAVGASLPNGYKAVAPPYALQNASNRQARQSQPIYVAVIEAGAVHSVLIGVYVQR